MQHISSMHDILYSDKNIRIALFDAQRHNSTDALYKWENEEEGSIVDMISAYQYTFGEKNIEKPLSMNLIHDIRSEMHNAQNGKYGNISQGINKVIDIRPRRFDITPGHDGFERMAKESNHLKNDLIDKGLLSSRIKLPYKITEKDGVKATLVSADAKISKKYYEAIVKRYNSKIRKAKLEGKEPAIETVIELVRDLERTHPYKDFNCRTFCVLVLNRELVKNGLQPSIMEDPNVFDYQDMDRLKISVQQGQKNFEYLKNHGIVHEHDPSNQELFDGFQQEAASAIEESIAEKKENELKITDYNKRICEYEKHITSLQSDNKQNYPIFIEDEDIQNRKIPMISLEVHVQYFEDCINDLKNEISLNEKEISEIPQQRKQLQMWAKKGQQLQNEINEILLNKLKEKEHDKFSSISLSSEKPSDHQHVVQVSQKPKSDDVNKDLKDIVDENFRKSLRNYLPSDRNKKKASGWSQDFLDLGSLKPSPVPKVTRSDNKNKSR